MQKMLKNKKGVTLVTVLIVVTVLVLLSAMLIEAIMQGFVLTKRHRNIDFAYYAGESAIEKWASIINKKVSDPHIGDGYTVNISEETSLITYAENILNKVDFTGYTTIPIDIENKTPSPPVAPASANSASVELVGKPNVVDVELNAAGSELIVSVGIKAKASYSPESTNYNTGNKIVYQIKKFKIKFPEDNPLESAIYSVGDIYINGGNNTSEIPAVVKGDVFSFGSYAEKINDPNQHYYGGIYSINKGKINIFGNAYSRSFIRTGPYGKAVGDVGYDDSSEIRIYKDAIAQCIQNFGNDDRIVVLRNAYTFDDIEMDGSNSVIAINGSFFGLSRNLFDKNHDNSSGLVNSAPVHRVLYDGSFDESFKSRIVINGDVILGGGTFKLANEDVTDPISGEEYKKGRAIGQIEDASLAWTKDSVGSFPYYKNFQDIDFFDTDYYHNELRNSFIGGNKLGLLNQIQAWNIVDPSNSSEIDSWLTSIENERAGGFKSGSGIYGRTESEYSLLNGFCFYEMIANDKLYTSSSFSSDYFVTSGIPDPLGPFRLDNIFDLSTNKIKYGEDCWDEIKLNHKVKLFGDSSDDSTEVGIGKMGVIKDKLESKVHKYISRDYPSSGDIWIPKDTLEFNKMLLDLKDKSSKVLSKYFLYVENDIGNDGGPRVTKDINAFYQDKNGPAINVYTESITNSRDTEYFIIVNADPDVDLEVNSVFNGIIVTAGKLILKDNADIYGSIIAAGGGSYDASGVFKVNPAAVTDLTVGNLDNGDYAAVKFVSADDKKSPSVDFFLGKVADASNPADMAKFVKDVINNIPRAKFLIPSDVADTNDNKLIYLNKAARINLLEKFDAKGINLYDIF